MPDDSNLSVTPTASNQPSPVQLPPPPAPKRPKKVLAIVGSIVFVLLIAGGMLLYLLLTKPATNSTSTKPTNLTSLGDGIKGALHQPTDASALVYKTTNPATVTYRFDSRNWAPTDTSASVLTVSSGRSKTSDNQNDYNATIKYLAANNFKEVKLIGQPVVAYSADQALVQYFASGDFSCTLHNTPQIALNGGPNPVPVSYRLQLDCAQLSSFKNNIAAIKPLAEAYSAAKTADAIKEPLFGTPTKVQASATKDYMNTKISIASISNPNIIAQAEFYQLPDKTWHFFTSAADLAKVSCSDYNTDDLKKAFTGFSCWDTSTNTSSFVEPSQPTFQVVPGAISDK